VHVVEQSVPLGLHAYPFGQSVGVVTQCPPLHVGTLRMLVVVLQVTLPHTPVPYVHAFGSPPHAPPQTPSVVHGARPPVGGPDGTVEQVPAKVGDRLHDWHWPSQRALQQTPSAQNPLVHSASAAQVRPSGFVVRQTPVLQKPPRHCASAAQLAPHTVPLHA
jgi:hypothetical protein